MTIDTTINRRGLFSGIAAVAVAGKTAIGNDATANLARAFASVNTIDDPVVTLSTRRQTLNAEANRLERISGAMRKGAIPDEEYARAFNATWEAEDRVDEIGDQMGDTVATSLAGIVAQLDLLRESLNDPYDEAIVDSILTGLRRMSA
jgi:hypothetical protein